MYKSNIECIIYDLLIVLKFKHVVWESLPRSFLSIGIYSCLNTRRIHNGLNLLTILLDVTYAHKIVRDSYPT